MTAPPASFVIDIIVPVYNAPDDVRACVDSVLAHLRPDVRLVLIDDASPDPRIAGYFAELEQRAHPQIVLLRNAQNLGFTGTANRGMQLSRADVVLLNSDTIVTAGWLDAIMHCAATDPRIGTITPFSNNAEICSFPRFCEDNPWPPGADPEPVRVAVAETAVPTYPDLPTGVGFCMYIRRALLDDVGLFDMAFGAGYGEENDLCLRAARAGWRNVLADNAFVVHTGGKSFAGQKSELGVRNMALLLERHPHYLDMVRSYIAADPLRPLRDAAAMRLAVNAEPGRGVLHVIHDHGGGTETHVRALIAGSRDRWRHYLAIAVGDRWQVEEHRADARCRHVRSGTWPAGVMGSVRRRHLRVVRHRAHPPAQHFRLSRRHSARAGNAARSVRLHGPRSQFRVPDDHLSRRRRHVLPRADRNRRLLALPRSAAGIRSHRHRRMAHAPSRTAAAGGVPDCAVAMDCRYAEAIFSGLSGDGDRPRLAGRAAAAFARCAHHGHASGRRRFRPSPCSARSGPTKARAVSSGWCNWCARGARPCASSSSAIWMFNVIPGSPTTPCLRSTDATRPPTCRTCWPTIAWRWCCTRRPAPRPSAIR